ncbi:MAG TPA: hypothetical protein VFV85_08060 [Conexibacter sp.]|nr:hypothetical protein [Conexibacter sp.]
MSSRPRRLPTVLACAAGACALSAPAAVAAHVQVSAPSAGKGVVLAAARHGLRLVGRDHRVGDVRVGSARGVQPGDRVAVRRGRARVTGRARKLAFVGSVARSSLRAVTLTLDDGSAFKLLGQGRRGRGARSAASASVGLQGLSAGARVLVTVAPSAQGDVLLAVKLISAPPAPPAPAELHVSGVVTDDAGDGAFGVTPAGADELELDDPQGLFESTDAGWCDVVDVAYHEDDGDLVADRLSVTGHSDDGDCADDDGAADEVDGTIAALAPDASSLTVSPDDGSSAQTIPVQDPSLLDGFSVGDDVAVTLDDDGTAVDVEPLVYVDPGDGDDQ